MRREVGVVMRIKFKNDLGVDYRMTTSMVEISFEALDGYRDVTVQITGNGDLAVLQGENSVLEYDLAGELSSELGDEGLEKWY
jgi:hypothetical protein